MQKLILSILPLLLLINSCTKNPNQTAEERKAIGEYTFEKVVLHKDGFKTENVTQQYNNMILQLNDKREAAIVDRNNSITYVGKYDIVNQAGTSTDDDGNTTTHNNHTIIIDIKSPGRGSSAFHWVGEDASFGNKLKFSARKTEGRYRFRLKKI